MIDLSVKEMEVLHYLTIGLRNGQIANILFMSNDTIKAHISSIIRKLHVRNRTEAAFYALKHKILDIDKLDLWR